MYFKNVKFICRHGKGPSSYNTHRFSASFVYMKLQTGTHLLCGMMFWLAGFLEVFVPWINLFKYKRSNSFVIVFTCSIAFKRYQTWYGNNYLNLIDCQASQKKDEVLVSLHRGTDDARTMLGRRTPFSFCLCISFKLSPALTLSAHLYVLQHKSQHISVANFIAQLCPIFRRPRRRRPNCCMLKGLLSSGKRGL